MMSDYEVLIPDESCMHDFFVKFDGPAETPYENGSWKIHVTLPADYPFKVRGGTGLGVGVRWGERERIERIPFSQYIHAYAYTSCPGHAERALAQTPAAATTTKSVAEPSS
mmetsp:Transcript_45400/g.125179  ORF Transcript_45400/g.125179 Transcript_45400/m.125179 type:complete len:111 (+) Transcript_45400:640-972(+)